MITIKEIAKQAGVSETTVSNVIHGKTSRVSPEMIEKIQLLLEKNNYVPRFGLSALTNRKSGMIGVVINTPDFVERTLYERPFYGNVIGILESRFRKAGYYILVCSSKDIQEIMRMILGWNVDGVICVSMKKKYYQEIAERIGETVVSIDMDVKSEYEASDCCNVTTKDVEAGEIMMRHLLGRGVKDVLFICNVESGADYLRYQGARKIYREYFGENSELKKVILGKTEEERYELYHRLEACAGKNMALFFSTDLNAAEAVGYFMQRNIQVPLDISVVGCDNDVFARLCNPGLTTVLVDGTKKAELAAEMMLKLLKGQEVKKNIMMDVELVERDSVK